MPSKADAYWQQFLDALPRGSSSPDRYLEFFSFGYLPEHGRSIGDLILDGKKTATADILWRRESVGLQTPSIGDLSIFHDGFESPMGVIETTEVEIVPFDEVTRDFAQSGGEWGGTLTEWRKSYWSWIEQECAAIGREPVTNIPMICERFNVVYSESLNGG